MIWINRKALSKSMIDFFIEKTNIKLDYKNSFYVGDAAGRLKTKTNKKDFACSDRMFALNANLIIIDVSQDGEFKPNIMPLLYCFSFLNLFSQKLRILKIFILII